MTMETPEKTGPTAGDPDALARAAYNGYGDSVDWKVYDGQAMPPWEAQDPQRRAAWRAAAAAVQRQLRASGVELR